MSNIKCPETHTDTYIVSNDELERMKTNGWISNEVVGLLGCNKCEDFYELVWTGEEYKNINERKPNETRI